MIVFACGINLEFSKLFNISFRKVILLHFQETWVANKVILETLLSHPVRFLSSI